MNKIHTHYDNLKVTRDAPFEVIKAAYRVIAQKHHPDTNQSDDSDRIMKIVNEAWRVLSDPKLRAEHDAWIAQQEKKVVFEPRPKDVYRSANFYASEDYKVKASIRDRFSLKIPDLKNVFYARTLLVWVLILGAMFAVGGLIERVRSWRKPEAVNYEYPRYEKSSSSVQISADKSAPSPNFIAELEPILKDETKSISLNENRVSLNGSKNKKYEFIPIKVPHGYIDGESIAADGGLSTFTVDNTSGDFDAEVRLYIDETQVRAFNVQVGRSFTASKLSPGTYKFRYRMFFNGKYHVYEANNLFEIIQSSTESEQGRTTKFSNVQVTLYKLANGNMSVREVDEGKF